MRTRKRTVVLCGYCGSSFEVKSYLLLKGWGKYCSKRCGGLANKDSFLKKVKDVNRKNEKHSQWKGDKAQYRAIHVWVNKNIDKDKVCIKCGRKEFVVLANITGVYGRDFANWEYLCRSHHAEFDKILQKAWMTRRGEVYENV